MVNCGPPVLDVWLPKDVPDVVVTFMFEVHVSGCELPIGFVGDIVPDVCLAPLSEPLMEPAMLVPPALAELNEYIEDTDSLCP